MAIENVVAAEKFGLLKKSSHMPSKKTSPKHKALKSVVRDSGKQMETKPVAMTSKKKRSSRVLLKVTLPEIEKNKPVAIEVYSETLGIKDTFGEEPEEFDEDKAKSNEEIEVEEGKMDSTIATKEKEVSTRADFATRLKAKGKAIAIESPNCYGPKNAYSHTFYDMKNERLFKKYSARGFIVERNINI